MAVINSSGRKIIVCLGSNCGDRYSEICYALDWLSRVMDVRCRSDIYESPESGGGNSIYYNCVVAGIYDGSYENLNFILKDYEKSRGRDPIARLAGKVPIDIDIVIIDGEIIRQRDYHQDFFQLGYKQIESVF